MGSACGNHPTYLVNKPLEADVMDYKENRNLELKSRLEEAWHLRKGKGEGYNKKEKTRPT